jgi:hypothetical protein
VSGQGESDEGGDEDEDENCYPKRLKPVRPREPPPPGMGFVFAGGIDGAVVVGAHRQSSTKGWREEGGDPGEAGGGLVANQRSIGRRQ